MFNVTGKRNKLETLKFIDTRIERISPRVKGAINPKFSLWFKNL